MTDDYSHYSEQKILEDLENVKIESDDIIREIKRVIDGQNDSDYIVRAAIIHSLSVVMTEYFCKNSDRGSLDAESAQTYWNTILYNMSGMVSQHYLDKAN